MTELRLHTATETPTPVEKVVEPEQAPAVEAPKPHDKDSATPIEVVKAEEKVAPAV